MGVPASIVNDWSPWREAPAAEFAVIGDPIAHSASPDMHNAVFHLLGLPFRYTAVQVPPDDLVVALDHLAGLGYRGVNVTLPHKEAAFAWADRADAFATRLGAANTLDLRGRAAANTDGPGLLDAVSALALRPGSRVLVLGAGGTARAAVFALGQAGFEVRVWNRTADRAVGLAKELGGTAVPLPDPAGCSLVLNTTSAGHAGDVPPVIWEHATAGAHALDASYGPSAGPFRRAAEAAGLTSSDGRAMLVAQGARSLAWWLGVAAPRTAMLDAVRARLGD